MDSYTVERAVEILNTTAITVDKMIKWIRDHQNLNAVINFCSESEEIELQIFIYNDWDECNEMYPFYGSSLHDCLIQAVVWLFDDV